MALISAFDNFFYSQARYRIRPRYVPIIHNDAFFSSMLNDTFGELQRLEMELGQLTQPTDTQKGDISASSAMWPAIEPTNSGWTFRATSW
ncbi:hypothetical protein Ddc_16813 [Ditylenchus destructor]|nr:hypothetical protein Ddc_16813 [Ditylenchus destructor]